MADKQDSTRRTYEMMDPHAITIVGLDTQDGPSHPLYDDRFNAPLDPALMENIKRFGVLKPAFVQRDGDVVNAVDGRRRILHARALNLTGLDIKVPVIFKRAGEADMYAIARSANRFQLDESPINNAKQAQRMLDLGGNMSDVAVTFGVSPQTVEDWTKLLDLEPAVQSQIHTGEVSVNAGLALAELPKALQGATLDSIRATGQKPSAEKVVAAVRAARGKQAPQTPKIRLGKIEDYLIKLSKLGADPSKEAVVETLSKICIVVTGKNFARYVASLQPKED